MHRLLWNWFQTLIGLGLHVCYRWCSHVACPCPPPSKAHPWPFVPTSPAVGKSGSDISPESSVLQNSIREPHPEDTLIRDRMVHIRTAFRSAPATQSCLAKKLACSMLRKRAKIGLFAVNVKESTEPQPCSPAPVWPSLLQPASPQFPFASQPPNFVQDGAMCGSFNRGLRLKC